MGKLVGRGRMFEAKKYKERHKEKEKMGGRMKQEERD